MITYCAFFFASLVTWCEAVDGRSGTKERVNSPSVGPSPTYPCILNKAAFITSESGYITSPGYPGPYGNNQTCVWRIQINSPTKGILFTSNSFETEYGVDKVTFNSFGVDRSDVDPVSGSSFAPVTIPETIVEVTFSTNSAEVRRGFRIKFEPIAAEPEVLNPDDECKVKKENAIYTFTGGYITSPNFPSQYGNNQKCFWTIRMLHPTRGIRLSSDSFNTEQRSDVVLIRAAGMRNDPMHSGFISGSNFTNLIFPVTQLAVWFFSDGTYTEKGFRIKYEPLDSHSVLTPNHPCSLNGTLVVNADFGYITSPNYPAMFSPNQSCKWRIAVSKGHGIRFSSDSYNMGEFTAQVVFSGRNTTIQGGSGWSLAPIFLDEDLVDVVFSSPPRFNGGGFQIKFEAVKITV